MKATQELLKVEFDWPKELLSEVTTIDVEGEWEERIILHYPNERVMFWIEEITGLQTH